MKIKFKQRVESRILLGGREAFYRLNLFSQQCTKAIIAKRKLRCLQWHNFLLKKVISSPELWHKLTLEVSKKTLLPHFWFLPERARHPRKKESLKQSSVAWRCHFSQRGKLVFFSISSFADLSVYGVFSIRWHQINYWILRDDGNTAATFSKLEIIYLGAKIFLSVPP